uniref:hypothetical protein n=1 Tax=uncultured Rothia sp. TaxID=316088 RepID=UPI0025E47355|nr:hypothetical protein [uncultured Rothia sp.]
MDPQFFDKYAPIIVPLLTAIITLPTAIMQSASAIMQLASAIISFCTTRLPHNGRKKASTIPRASSTSPKCNSGTCNDNGNRAHNTHQQAGNDSTATSGNNKHAHSLIHTKGAQVSDEDTFSGIAAATFVSILIVAAFLISWPTISWILAACWILYIAFLGWQIKLLSSKSINSPEHAILNVLYPASLLAIIGGTWFTLRGAGQYNMATIYTTISGHYESHPQGGMVARFIEAVTASYGTAGFTLLTFNFLAILFMLGTLVQCFKYSINTVIAFHRDTTTSLSIQEASMSFFLAVVSLVVCQPALAELIVSQFNR